jgi:PKD repeat protein
MFRSCPTRRPTLTDMRVPLVVLWMAGLTISASLVLAQTADFSMTPIAPVPAQDENYFYQDLCPGSITSMLWDYGDGGSFNNTNPGANGCDTTHGYTNLGMYRVLLTVFPSTNQQVRDIGVRSNADGQADLTANFSWSPPNPAPGQIVTFNDLTTPASSVGQWQWDFDDATKSYIHNPTKGFPAGDHPVTLTVQNQGSFQQKTLSVHVALPVPVASFTFSPPNPTTSSIVQFTDTSTGSPSSWSWDFGDPGSGGNNTSTLQNPTHTFSANGPYTVTLVASNSNGSSNPFMQQVTVGPIGTLPVANFTYSANGLAVAFTDTSSGPPDSWAWNFGDVGSPNNQSFVQNPSHVFTHAGSFTVSLMVSNSSGSSSKTRTLVVQSGTGPVADFSFVATALSVAFTDLSTGTPTSWSWDFGDPTSGPANVSSSQNPTHVFSGPGSYTVTLTASNAHGASAPMAHTVVVSNCAADTTTLCLNVGRFKIQVAWSVPSQNRSGVGQAVALTSDTGYFWFFNAANVELVIKVLDATGVNQHFWVFYGALSNVQYRITVTDTLTNAVQVYENPSGTLASHADTSAFPSGASPASAEEAASSAEIDTRSAEELYAMYAVLAQATATPKAAPAGCTPDGTTLCLHQARFRVSVDWEVPSQGRSGTGMAVPITDDTGYFWFFVDTNVELTIKVLDGTGVNGHYWVFYGALSNVKYTITVRDTLTGNGQSYVNESGNQASRADTSAF